MTIEFNPSDTLLHLAIVLVAGIVGGELVARIKLPKVTGWIFTGILLRGLNLPWLTPETVSEFAPYMNFVLGYIAFTVGAALHFATLRNTGQRLGLLLLGEALITPTVVAGALYFGSRILADDLNLAACLILASIAIAGAPGTTVLVVQEARARGILTRTLLAAVALIDMVAVGVFVFAAAFLASDGDHLIRWQSALTSVGFEFGFTFAVGAASAIVALLLTRSFVGPAFVGPTMVAVILASWGGAVGFGVSGILACTFAGITVSNLRHDTVRSTEAYLHAIGTVLFAGFFTMAGMKLDFSKVLASGALVLLFFAARFVGKYAGAYAAMSFAKVPSVIRNNLGLSLLPHGGVAVGLVLLVQENSRLQGVADVVTTVGLAALAINQLLGPSVTRAALKRAGEAGKDRARLLDFLDEHHITVNITGNTKEDVVRSLATQLYATASAPSLPLEEFVQAVLDREDEESTCLGEGLMIPHAILDTSDELTGMLGISTKGLDFDSPDGRPIHAILLLATPRVSRKRHLEILAAFAKAITRDEHLREQLYHAHNAAHAYLVLHAEAAEDINYFLEEAMERAYQED